MNATYRAVVNPVGPHLCRPGVAAPLSTSGRTLINVHLGGVTHLVATCVLDPAGAAARTSCGDAVGAPHDRRARDVTRRTPAPAVLFEATGRGHSHRMERQLATHWRPPVAVEIAADVVSIPYLSLLELGAVHLTKWVLAAGAGLLQALLLSALLTCRARRKRADDMWRHLDQRLAEDRGNRTRPAVVRAAYREFRAGESPALKGYLRRRRIGALAVSAAYFLLCVVIRR